MTVLVTTTLIHQGKAVGKQYNVLGDIADVDNMMKYIADRTAIDVEYNEDGETRYYGHNRETCIVVKVTNA